MKVTDGVENTQEETKEVEKVEENTPIEEKKQEIKGAVKTYTDEEVNAISLKNSDKAVKKFMKELGIEDVEKAKEILNNAKAEQTKEENKDISELEEKANKATIQAMDLKVENALLLKGVNLSKANRAKRLIDKANILNDEGETDEDKLNKEIENLFKDFPELNSNSNKNAGFVLGSDGKEDKKEDEMSKMKKIMGL